MSEVNNKYLNIIWLEKGVTWKIREKIINCMKIKVCLKSMRDRAKMALEAILQHQVFTWKRRKKCLKKGPKFPHKEAR